jgi:hypothetical protein
VKDQIKTVCKHLFDNQDDLQEADAQHTAERTAVLLHGWQSLLQHVGVSLEDLLRKRKAVDDAPKAPKKPRFEAKADNHSA